MAAGSSTGKQSKVYEADADMFRKGANDAYNVIRQVTRAENELTLADVLTFIADQNIQVDTNAQTRLDEFNDLVSRALYKPPIYNNAYISGLRTTYDLFVHNTLFEDGTATEWVSKLNEYGVIPYKQNSVTPQELNRYIDAVLVEMSGADVNMKTMVEDEALQRIHPDTHPDQSSATSPLFLDNLHFERFDKYFNRELWLTILSKCSKWRLSKKRGLVADD